jgi:hypothetical protein
MRALVMGAVQRSGTGKESGAEYDFTVVKTLRPAENFNGKKMTVRAAGLTDVEVQADPVVVEQLRALNAKFPCELELITDVRAGRSGQLEIFVTGIGK